MTPIILLVLSGLWLSALASSAQSARPPAFRGIWVDAFSPGFLTAEQVQKLADDCRKYHFNAVIVEMRRRGDAFYVPHPPNKDPRTTALTSDFDALAELIQQCHSGTPRLEVHCWIVSHFIWSWKRPPPQEKHLYNLHPEYLTRNSVGQKLFGNGYYLDPGHPDANQWIHDVAVDVVSHYDVDGLHWDYCRYPDRDSGYNETALKRYKQETGATDVPPPGDRQFSDWRRRQVTDFLRWVNSDLWAIKPSLVISAAVFSNLNDSYGYRFGDWPAWNQEGLIDVAMPMDFTDENSIFQSRAVQAITNQGSRAVFLGQAGYKNSLEASLSQLRYACDLGFSGTVLYDYSHPSCVTNDGGVAFKLLAEKHQPSWAATPKLSWKRATGIVRGLVKSADSKPVYNAAISLSPEASADPGNTNSAGTFDCSARFIKTEPHGAYAFFNLKPGGYLLTATAGAAPPQTKRLAVNAGAVATCDFEMPAKAFPNDDNTDPVSDTLSASLFDLNPKIKSPDYANPND